MIMAVAIAGPIHMEPYSEKMLVLASSVELLDGFHSKSRLCVTRIRMFGPDPVSSAQLREYKLFYKMKADVTARPLLGPNAQFLISSRGLIARGARARQSPIGHRTVAE